MSMINDMRDHLRSEGITQDIFLSQKDDEPSTCIVLYQSAGSPPLPLSNLKELNLQVLSRAADYETAMTNIEAIEPILNAIGDQFNATFDSQGNVTNGLYPSGKEINSILYTRIIANQSAFPTGLDEDNRHEIKQNFSVIRRNQ